MVAVDGKGVDVMGYMGMGLKFHQHSCNHIGLTQLVDDVGVDHVDVVVTLMVLVGSHMVVDGAVVGNVDQFVMDIVVIEVVFHINQNKPHVTQ